MLDNRISTWYQMEGFFSVAFSCRACNRTVAGYILTSSTEVCLWSLWSDYVTIGVLTWIVSELKDRSFFSKVFSNIRSYIQIWKFSYSPRQSSAIHPQGWLVKVGKGCQSSVSRKMDCWTPLWTTEMITPKKKNPLMI